MSLFPSRRSVALAFLLGFPVIGAMRSYGEEQCFYHFGSSQATEDHPHNEIAAGHVHDDGDDHQHAAPTVPPHKHLAGQHSCNCHSLCQGRSVSLAADPANAIPEATFRAASYVVEFADRIPVRFPHTLPYSTAPPSLT